MKFTGSGVFENENSDSANLIFVEFGFEQIRNDIEHMKNSSMPTQNLLADIQIVIFLIELLPHSVSGRIKKSEIVEWESCFNEWFERVKSKIPKKYRDDIKKDSERLFEELKQYGHSIDWL